MNKFFFVFLAVLQQQLTTKFKNKSFVSIDGKESEIE